MTRYAITTPDQSTTLTQETVGAFRQCLRGPLLSPRDAGFEEATRLWNGMIDKTPALVVSPTGTADVVAAVRFAREHDFLLSVRGGGHNLAGTALVDGGRRSRPSLRRRAGAFERGVPGDGRRAHSSSTMTPATACSAEWDTCSWPTPLARSTTGVASRTPT